jgi:XTP/dITP diphosphohydrolase
VTGRRLLIATHSSHKLRELRELLELEETELVSFDDLGIAGEPVEDGETFETNAAIKARFGVRASGLPTLADDSGIEVDALGGGPGPRSARYAGEDASEERNLSALLSALKGVPTSGRTARYRCIAALVLLDGSERSAEGVCEGTLTAKPRGSGGFGYDPIFVPAGWDVTMAELSSEEKDRISHRGRAFREMRARLAED